MQFERIRSRCILSEYRDKARLKLDVCNLISGRYTVDRFFFFLYIGTSYTQTVVVFERTIL